MSKRTSRPSGAGGFAPNTSARVAAFAAAALTLVVLAFAASAQQKSPSNANAKPDDSAHYGATSASPIFGAAAAVAAAGFGVAEVAP